MSANIKWARSVIEDIFNEVEHGECFYERKDAEYVKRRVHEFIGYLDAAVKDAEKEELSPKE